MEAKQRKAGIVLNYLTEGIRILTALVYTPVMLRLLGQREYGLYQMALSVVSYLGLLNFGFGSAYIRYYSRYREAGAEENIARLNGMFLLIFTVLAMICLVCGAILVTGAQLVFGSGLTQWELEKARRLLSVLVVHLALTLVNSVFDSYLTARERFLFQKGVSLVQSILSPFLTLPLLMLGWGSEAVVWISLILAAGTLLMNGIRCRSLRMGFSVRNLQPSLLREMLGFTFFIFLNQIIDQINWSTDKFLLGRIQGTAAVAVYGIGAQINSLYIQMSTAVSSVFIPKVHQLAAKTRANGELSQLMARVGRLQAVILGLVISGFALFGAAFVRLWAGGGYGQSYFVALLLMIPITIPLIQNLGIEIQRARGKHRVRSVVYACLAAGNVAVSILLIPRWGCIGAAAGTALSLLLGNVLFMNWHYGRCLRLDMKLFWREILSLAPAWALAGLIGMVLSLSTKQGGWGELLGAVALYTTSYAAAMWRFGLNRQEKQQLLELLPGK